MLLYGKSELYSFENQRGLRADCVAGGVIHPHVIVLCPGAVDLNGHWKTWPFKIPNASRNQIVRNYDIILHYRAKTIDYFLHIAYNISN